MGGKTATSSSQVQIPPEIMAQYNAVNAKAEQAASQPFQKYSDNPNAFVAPMTGTQNAGEANINRAQGAYQPFYNNATKSLLGGQAAADPLQAQAQGNISKGLGAGQMGTQAAVQSGQSYLNPAAGLTGASAGAVDPSALGAAQIGQFMSPYNEGVVQSTMANLHQQQQQEQSAETGNQIQAGAFGGDRGAVAKANLARQQDMASGQVLSGLYNQNYSQALGAAQQQQGVGLQAGQANRAALGAAGAQFGQLGAESYGQLSGAANQTYNQSLGAASAQAGLGQQEYGQGAATSQQLQNLGNGAFNNQLTGGQAQMGAGQVEQQTQQAGLGALYNQFTQEKGYPFQTTQFLGQMAYGQPTGSTTTSTQPTGFFSGLMSDARMKENIEPIGETYDGQKIVKFRYKGHREKEIGLIAQDVEHRHPSAVREHGGIKYVDYDRATHQSADRGHFAEGGVAGDMFPYGAEGGSRIGQGKGAYGVSTSHLPRGKFMQAKAPSPQPDGGGLHSVAEAAGEAKDLGDDIKKASKWVQGLGGGDTPPSTGALPADAGWSDDVKSADDDATGTLKNRGGLVRTTRSTGGRDSSVEYGKPYDTDDGYVPTEKDGDNSDQLKKADVKTANTGSTSGQQSGGLGDMAKAAGDVMKLVALFNRGGTVSRKGYATTGAVQDLMDYKSGLGGGDQVEEAPDDGSDDEPSPFLHGIKKGIDWTDKNVARPAIHYLTGYTPPERRILDDDAADPAKETALGAASTAPAATPAVTPRPTPAATQTPVAPPAQAAAPTPAPDQAPAPAAPQTGLGAAAAAPEKAAMIAQIAKKAEEPGWINRNQSWLIPMLKGVGAMASSPSRFLGAAALQGLGAAAGAYQPQQQAEAKTERMNVEAQQAQLDLEKGDVYTDAGGNPVVKMPDGHIISQAQWFKMGRPPTLHQKVKPQGGAGAPTAPGASGPNNDQYSGNAYAVGDAGSHMAQSLVQTVPTWDLKKKATEQEISSHAAAQNQEDARNAAINMNGYRKLTSMILQQPSEGIESPDVLNPLKHAFVSKWNAIATTMGKPDLQVDPAAQDLVSEINKVTSSNSFRQADQAGQHSLTSLQQALGTQPGNQLTKTQSLAILSKLMTDSDGQMSIDRSRYNQNFSNTITSNYGASNAYLEHRANDAFSLDHPATEYQREQAALTAILQKKPDLAKQLIGGQIDPTKFDDAVRRKYGLKSGLSRYLMGTQ